MATAEPDRQHEEDDFVLADKTLLRQAEDILIAMANAVSAMKIFPSDHATVRNFIDGLAARFDEFFASYQRLEVGVEEFAFTCAGQAVYADDVPLKSLPFFFFKDGAQILYFYRGLSRDEITQFLEIIKKAAHDPSGNNDIVAALWESDLSNIQYYAPDEFLENQILNEDRAVRADQNLPELPSDLAHETLEVKVDLAKFSQGRIEIDPDDLSKFHWTPGGQAAPPTEEDRSKSAEPDPSASPDDSSGLDRSPAASADPSLSEGEIQTLETMVRANRVLCPEDEFVGLTTEVVFLENDLPTCAEALDVLADFVLDRTEEGQFQVAGSAIKKIGDLRAFLGGASSPKAAPIDACLRKLTGPRALRAVETFLASGAPLDGPALLDFFRLLGPVTLPTVASIYESRTDLDLRGQIMGFIETAAAGDPQLIVSLANDARPVLSLEIMRLLLRMPDDKGLPGLLAFVIFKNKDIKLEVIHALGNTKSEMSNRILLAFLNDPDEELRIQAAMKLDPSEEQSRVDHIVREASAAAFRKKGLREKQALLTFLGRTRSPAALEFLTSAAVKTTFWPSRQNKETRLAALQGLESMGTDKAAAALESAARLRGRSVRLAAAEALARLRATRGRE